jgi:isopentenyl-diphosphate delta-isomerase
MKPTDRSERISPETRHLITVDEEGRSRGVADSHECHQGDGLLHSAFLVMIFDRQNRLLQAKRSVQKKLWPRYWDGTVAGHFYPGEDMETSLKRRIKTEVGLDCRRPKYLFQFLYKARYSDIGIEREVCRIYIADNLDMRSVPFNPAEVMECRFLDVQELGRLLERNASEITPWFTIAFQKSREHGLF